MRNIPGCPLQGLTAHELFDCSGIITEAAESSTATRTSRTCRASAELLDFRTCSDRCNATGVRNCIALVGAIHEGREGFECGRRAVVGTPPGPRPRCVFVPEEARIEVLAAITERVGRLIWNTRVSRVKARLKFMVDDLGVDGMRERVEAQPGRTLEDYALEPAASSPATISASSRSASRGSARSGFRSASG